MRLKLKKSDVQMNSRIARVTPNGKQVLDGLLKAVGLVSFYAAIAVAIAIPLRRLVGLRELSSSSLITVCKWGGVALALVVGLSLMASNWISSAVGLAFPEYSTKRFYCRFVGLLLYAGTSALALRESISALPFAPAWAIHLIGIFALWGTWISLTKLFRPSTDSKQLSSWALSDAPITSADSDKLNRLRNARDLASDLNRLPGTESVRLAITAGWGEGKTSFMHLLSGELSGERGSKQQHRIVWFFPWRYRDYDSVRTGLYRTLLGAFLAAPSAQLGPFIQFFMRLIPGETVPSLLNSVLFTSNPSNLDEAKALLSNYLKANGRQGGKVFLFIDDLDRAQDTIIYDLLMVANELIDLPGLITVFGLSTASTVSALKRHHGHEDDEARRFLDKILQWQIPLPTVRESTKAQFLDSLLKEETKELDGDSLRSLTRYLPGNPRTLKMFLRLLAGCQSVFGRYAPEEFSFKAAYAAQLIRYEFPDLLITLKDRPEDRKTLLHKSSPLKSRDDFDKKYKEVVAWIKEQHSGIKLDRLNELMAILTEKTWILDHADFYLYEAHEHSTLTFREYSEIKGAALKQSEPAAMVFEKVKESTTGAAYPDEALSSFLSHLARDIRDRNSEVIHESTQKQKKEIVERDLLPLIEFTERLVSHSDWWKASDRWFDIPFLRSIRRALLENANFRNEPCYEQVRAAEHQVLLKIQTRISEDPGHYIYAFDPFAVSESRDEHSAKLVQEMIAPLKSALAKRLIEEIKKSPGFEDKIRGEEHQWHQMVLFDATSPLYTDSGLKAAFVSVLMTRDVDRTLHENAIGLLRRILHGLSENVGHGSPGGMRKCFSENSDVLREIVALATREVLDRRIVGSMEENIKTLEQDAEMKGLAAQIRSHLPPWWTEVLVGSRPS